MGKQEYIKCPRCELNWILKKQDLCDVCKAELNYDGSQNYEEEEEIEEFLDDIEELCPVCKSNYIHGKETMCESCRRSKYSGLDDIEKSEEEWDDDEKDETCDIEDEDEEKLISLNAMQEEENEDMDEEDGLKDDFDDIEIDSIDDGDLDDYEESDDDAEDI